VHPSFEACRLETQITARLQLEQSDFPSTGFQLRAKTVKTRGEVNFNCSDAISTLRRGYAMELVYNNYYGMSVMYSGK
jgi:hypothetical protein